MQFDSRRVPRGSGERRGNQIPDYTVLDLRVRDRRALREYGCRTHQKYGGTRNREGSAHRRSTDYAEVHALRKSCALSGNERIRLPIAAETAFTTAGGIGACAGSPTPPQKPPVGAITTSTLGISASFIMR